MIRVLVIGTQAGVWCARLGAVAPSAEFEAARLPAAAIREFERSPADAVILCGEGASGRLAGVLEALRERPLGRLVPCLALGVDGLDVDAEASDDANPADVVMLLAELLGFEPDEIARGSTAAVTHAEAGDEAPLSETRIERKLRQVRHETYFEVLEVTFDVAAADLRGAFARLWAVFDARSVPAELDHRFSDELAEVRDGLEDAFAVLSNEKLRAAYSESRRPTNR